MIHKVYAISRAVLLNKTPDKTDKTDDLGWTPS